MALYGLVQYSTGVILQFYYTYPSDLSFTYWDVCLNFLFFIFVGYTPTADSLSDKKPQARLSGCTSVCKVLMMYVLQLIGQILMIIFVSTVFAEEIDYFNTGTAAGNYEKYKKNGGNFDFDTP